MTDDDAQMHQQCWEKQHRNANASCKHLPRMPAASTDQRNHHHHHHSSPKFGAHTHTHTTPSECAQPPCHVHVELIRTTQQHNATTVCGSLTNQAQRRLTVTPSKPRQELVGYRMHVGEKSRSRGYTQGECSGVRRWWVRQGVRKRPPCPDR